MGSPCKRVETGGKDQVLLFSFPPACHHSLAASLDVSQQLPGALYTLSSLPHFQIWWPSQIQALHCPLWYLYTLLTLCEQSLSQYLLIVLI